MMGHIKFARLRELRFLQLSLLIIAFMFASPFLRQNWLFQILVQLFMLISLLVTLSATGSNRVRTRRSLWILWMVTATASLAGFLPKTSPLHAFGAQLELGGLALLLLGCVVCILIFVFRNLRASMDGIFAAFAAYLLLASTFAMVYTLVCLWDPLSFRMSVPAGGNPAESFRIEMVYFSFVTIATLGYGDVVPITPFARMLAVIEAVAGQFYVAVVVALLVGSLIAQSPPPRDDDR
jgi:hypothetical protein